MRLQLKIGLILIPLLLTDSGGCNNMVNRRTTKGLSKWARRSRLIGTLLKARFGLTRTGSKKLPNEIEV